MRTMYLSHHRVHGFKMLLTCFYLMPMTYTVGQQKYSVPISSIIIRVDGRKEQMVGKRVTEMWKEGD